MAEGHAATPEFPNIVTLLAHRLQGTPFANYLYLWENIIFSVIIIGILILIAHLASRKSQLIPGRLQGAVELFVGSFDNLICGILGEHGRKYIPFLGTLFIYILFMNLIGLIPFFKSPSSSWSTTAALALCVFVYVQYTAVREMGFLGYIDHLAGKPRGAFLLTIIFPAMMLVQHVVSELLKPFTLSLRLRSNVLGEDILLAVVAGFGLKGLPLLLFGMFLATLTAIVQAFVFCILSAIYFALVLTHEE